MSQAASTARKNEQDIRALRDEGLTASRSAFNAMSQDIATIKNDEIQFLKALFATIQNDLV